MTLSKGVLKLQLDRFTHSTASISPVWRPKSTGLGVPNHAHWQSKKRDALEKRGGWILRIVVQQVIATPYTKFQKDGTLVLLRHGGFLRGSREYEDDRQCLFVCNTGVITPTSMAPTSTRSPPRVVWYPY